MQAGQTQTLSTGLALPFLRLAEADSERLRRQSLLLSYSFPFYLYSFSVVSPVMQCVNLSEPEAVNLSEPDE